MSPRSTAPHPRLRQALPLAAIACALLRLGSRTALAAPIELDLDAAEAARRIFHSRLVVPAAPGPLTLVYPKWIPGEHGPTGPVADLAGLKIRAGGREIAWRRDETDMYAIRFEVPPQSDSVEVRFDFLSPPPAVGGFSSSASASAQMAVVSWNQVLLYPQGRPARDLELHAALTLPGGWKLGSALPIETQSRQRVVFRPVSLERLVDSPVIAGTFFREIPIGPSGGKPHFLELAADSAAALEIPPAVKAGYDRLVEEAGALFGSAHYGSYRFLVSLSDRVAHFGLEHHESSDDRWPERVLIDEDLRKIHSGLLPHEFVHSWNGKFRRPADIATPDYQVPMRTGLLWVYEGLTEYLGDVLAARSGIRTPEQARDDLALTAEWLRGRRGREWRPLVDTSVAAQILYEARGDWASWRRGVDFYNEGTFLWLEIDTMIRQQTAGQRSLDDFCRRFLGGEGAPYTVRTYTLEDVVADLNAVAPYDWKAFLRERVEGVAKEPPLGGLERGGWKLAYAETRSDLLKADEDKNKRLDLSASIGLLLKEDGLVVDVVPGMAADRAGVGPGMTLVAVNTRRFTPEVLRAGVAATKAGASRLELLVENGDYLKPYRLEYGEGEKYPRLERDPSRPDLLGEILKPLSPAAAPHR